MLQTTSFREESVLQAFPSTPQACSQKHETASIQSFSRRPRSGSEAALSTGEVDKAGLLEASQQNVVNCRSTTPIPFLCAELTARNSELCSRRRAWSFTIWRFSRVAWIRSVGASGASYVQTFLGAQGRCKQMASSLCIFSCETPVSRHPDRIVRMIQQRHKHLLIQLLIHLSSQSPESSAPKRP